MACDGRSTHFTVAAEEAALPFRGTRGLMRGTGTMCHWQPHKAPVGLLISFVPPHTRQKDPTADTVLAVHEDRF